jgi:predicted nucleic acid-binding protein
MATPTTTPKLKPRIYVETSVISYLTARPSRDLIVAAHQQLTLDWWQTREQYQLCVSRLVEDEAAQGDAQAATQRLQMLRDMPQLALTVDVDALTVALLQAAALPAQAVADAVHVALAAVHEVDYLLTWNCKHIANAAKRHVIERTCNQLGWRGPVICTPEELLGHNEA